jgi:glutamate 5-kinase
VDGLYDRNPQMDNDARLISTVDEITKDIERIAGGNKNARSVGGMRTKIVAARIAMQSGCNTVIANGQVEDVILKVVRGEEIGTLFTSHSKYNNRQRWMLFGSPRGKIVVDEGAERALRSGKSLLPCGIIAVEGKFKEGDLVRIGGFAKGVTNFSDSDLLALKLKCLMDKERGDEEGQQRQGGRQPHQHGHPGRDLSAIPDQTIMCHRHQCQPPLQWVRARGLRWTGSTKTWRLATGGTPIPGAG